MKALPLIHDCSLSEDGLERQRVRAALLRPAVERVERRPAALAVTFGNGFDRRVLDELIETERGCCSFLTIDYDEGARVLLITVEDQRRTPVLDVFGAFFSGEAVAV